MGQCVSKSASTPSIQKIETDSTVSIDYQIKSPRFSVSDQKQLERGVEHLNEYGYAVFSDVLSSAEVTSNIDLFWKHLEDLAPPYHIKRNDAQTWENPWPGVHHFGIISGEGFGQSQFLWTVRGNPNVKKVFTRVWQTPELLVSFDAVGCFRDWSLNPAWKTNTGWYHCDQNPAEKPGRCSIQGLVALTDNNEFTGGLVIVPQSHKYFDQLQSNAHIGHKSRNYVQIESTHPLLKQFQPRLVKCKAGDLIIWDSRCIHCNAPAQQLKPQNKTKSPQLLRIVSYVCMSPTSMIPNEELEEFRRKRKEFVKDRTSCTHWPIELILHGGPQMNNIRPLRLSGYQQSLIVGTNVDPEDEVAKQITDM